MMAARPECPRTRLGILLLALAGAGALGVTLGEWPVALPGLGAAAGSTPVPRPVARVRVVEPWKGTETIAIRAYETYPLMSLAALDPLRSRRVQELAHLNVFPPEYSVRKGLSAPVWSQIDPGAGWVADTQFYLENPYLLVVVAHTPYVNALMLGERWPDVTYRDGKFVETWRGRQAHAWDRMACSDQAPCELRLWAVNARDAGLGFASVDPALSRNVSASASGPENVLSAVVQIRDFFHMGLRGANNLSPHNERFVLRVDRPGDDVVIHVKLWPRKPSGPEEPAPVAWEVRIEHGTGPRPRRGRPGRRGSRTLQGHEKRAVQGPCASPEPLPCSPGVIRA